MVGGATTGTTTAQSDQPGTSTRPCRAASGGVTWAGSSPTRTPRPAPRPIRDFARFPELRFLNRFHLLPPFLLAVAIFLIGGLPLLVWGFFVSTVVLWHGTFTINSLSHVFGSRRYKTTDTSRNNFLLALVTCGEGWHNNHHYHQNTANQGWFWWEVDATYYLLRLLSGLGADLGSPDAHRGGALLLPALHRRGPAQLRNAPFGAGQGPAGRPGRSRTGGGNGQGRRGARRRRARPRCSGAR